MGHFGKIKLLHIDRNVLFWLSEGKLDGMIIATHLSYIWSSLKPFEEESPTRNISKKNFNLNVYASFY